MTTAFAEGITSHAIIDLHAYLHALPYGIRTLVNPEDLSKHNCIAYTELSNRNLWSFKAGASATDIIGTAKTIRVEGHLQTNSSKVR
jgi:hypothetical protein